MSQLCALNDVKVYLGITDGNSDIVLTAIIGNVSAAIESFCNRTFAVQSYVETRNGGCGPKMYLSNGPIVSVASVTVDTYNIPPAANALAFGFVFDENVLYIRPGGYPGEFTKGVQNVVVSYTAGFAATPADVNQACVELVAWKYAKRNRIDKKNEILAAQTVGFDLSDMPASVKSALQPYVRWSAPA